MRDPVRIDHPSSTTQRYFGIIFHHSATRRAIQLPDITGCDVNVISSNLSLTIDTDESYTLEVVVCYARVPAHVWC
jgi:hypothetical protein